jgi:EAL domain-containing protein (putative c-di-GMP-specific phosphodiesterase class I)
MGASTPARRPRVVAGGAPVTTRLFLWPATEEALAATLSALGERDLPHLWRKDGACLVISAPLEALDPLLDRLAELLPPEALQDARVLPMHGEGEPELLDFQRVMPLKQLILSRRSAWLGAMLGDERYTTYFQPIVCASATSRIFAHEALWRGIDELGAVVLPGPLFDLGRDAGMLFQLDRAARGSAIRHAARHKLALPIFINLAPSSIYDPIFCLGATASAVGEVGLRPENVVFELTECDRTQDPARLREIMDFFRGAGFRVALDDLGAGYSSLNLIHQLRPDFIKLDMELIRDIHEDPYKGLIAEKLLEIASRLGIQTIVEGIENEGELRWVREHGADFVQGFLIAHPTPAPLAATPELTPAG